MRKSTATDCHNKACGGGTHAPFFICGGCIFHSLGISALDKLGGTIIMSIVSQACLIKSEWSGCLLIKKGIICVGGSKHFLPITKLRILKLLNMGKLLAANLSAGTQADNLINRFHFHAPLAASG